MKISRYENFAVSLYDLEKREIESSAKNDFGA